MPFPALLKSAGTGLETLYPHSLPGGLKRREKKRRDRNFDPIPALFGAVPAVLKTLGYPRFFVVGCCESCDSREDYLINSLLLF